MLVELEELVGKAVKWAKKETKQAPQALPYLGNWVAGCLKEAGTQPYPAPPASQPSGVEAEKPESGGAESLPADAAANLSITPPGKPAPTTAIATTHHCY